MIRHAELDDVPALLEMGRAFFDEAGWSDVAEYDAASMGGTFRHLIGDDSGALLVAEVGGKLVGMAGALLYPLYFNAASLAGQELFWWVDPAFRRGVGADLLEALERAARAGGARSFIMISVAGLRSGALDRVYRRRGYRPAELTYMKRL